MSKMETIEDAAEAHRVRASSTPGEQWGSDDIRDAFKEGAKWAGYQRLRLSMPAVSGVSQTEITPPPYAGTIVEVIEFNGRLLVCCQNGIFHLTAGLALIPLRFVTG